MMKAKTPMLDEFVCFQIGIKDFWLEDLYYFTSVGAISHNVYQQLPNARYQVSF